jgi:hypothetical protein
VPCAASTYAGASPKPNSTNCQNVLIAAYFLCDK